jgi:hypothetical protein
MGNFAVKFNSAVDLTISSPADGIIVRVTQNEDPIKAKQYETVEWHKPRVFHISDSSSYQLVSLNDQGDPSQVIRVTLTNQDEEYHLIVETPPIFEAKEREYRFRNPVDRRSLTILLKDIIKRLKADQAIPPGDIGAAFKEAAESELPDSGG